MIDFTLAELLTGLDLELTDHAEFKPVTVKAGSKPVSPPDESSVATDEAEAEKPE